MNFTTNTLKPRIATKDIVAYIVIDGSYKSGRRIIGDKKDFKFNKRILKEGDVEMWHIYTHIYPKRKTEINGVPIKIEDIKFKGYGIGDGVYHLYKNKKDAILIAGYSTIPDKVYKAIIPAGTAYYPTRSSVYYIDMNSYWATKGIRTFAAREIIIHKQ